MLGELYNTYGLPICSGSNFWSTFEIERFFPLSITSLSTVRNNLPLKAIKMRQRKTIVFLHVFAFVEWISEADDLLILFFDFYETEMNFILIYLLAIIFYKPQLVVLNFTVLILLRASRNRMLPLTPWLKPFPISLIPEKSLLIYTGTKLIIKNSRRHQIC